MSVRFTPSKLFVSGLIASGLVGVALGSGLTFEVMEGWYNQTSTNVEPQPRVTVTAEPEVVVDTTSQGVVQLPGACVDAINLASDIDTTVSEVAGSMGEQKQIMSNGRLALNGSNYIDINMVIRQQSELEKSLGGAYNDLASESISLDNSLAECNELLER